MWYVYFLQVTNGDVYVGSTNDLKRRFSSADGPDMLSTHKATSRPVCQNDTHIRISTCAAPSF
jgi:predicted GIY-YIG superfamily endonuclease